MEWTATEYRSGEYVIVKREGYWMAGIGDLWVEFPDLRSAKSACANHARASHSQQKGQ